MFLQLKLMNFEDIRDYFLTKFLSDALYCDSGLLEKYFIDFIPNHGYAHDYQTRNLPNVRLEMEKNFTIFQSIRYFNSLPVFLKQPMSDFRFKKLFEEYILAKY